MANLKFLDSVGATALIAFAIVGVSPVVAQTEDTQTEDTQSSGYRSGGTIVVTAATQPVAQTAQMSKMKTPTLDHTG